MFKVMMILDGETYKYGTYDDESKANEVAMWVRDARQLETYVEEA